VDIIYPDMVQDVEVERTTLNGRPGAFRVFSEDDEGFPNEDLYFRDAVTFRKWMERVTTQARNLGIAV
jgi:hypothetical protein